MQKIKVEELVWDVASQETLAKADRECIDTVFSRYETQKNQCKFGTNGVCCRICHMGPCRTGTSRGGAILAPVYRQRGHALRCHRSPGRRRSSGSPWKLASANWLRSRFGLALRSVCVCSLLCWCASTWRSLSP